MKAARIFNKIIFLKVFIKRSYKDKIREHADLANK